MRGGSKKLERSEQQVKTLDLAVAVANEYVASVEGTPNAITNPQWCQDVSDYINHLVTDHAFPAHAKRRLGEETRRLARQWVDTACKETGLKPPGK